MKSSTVFYKGKAGIYDPSISNDDEFMNLRFDPNSLKIFETEESEIAFSKPVPIVLAGEPTTNIHNSVANESGLYVTTLPSMIPWKWLQDKMEPVKAKFPLTYINVIEPIIDLRPKNEKIPLEYLDSD